MIRAEQLHLRAGTFQLSDISFHIEKGAYAILMGKTGCGKTTLLEALCGLKRVVSGRIHLDGVDVTRFKPAARNIGFVPQDAALFHGMTIRDHLGFALDVRGWTRDRIRRRVEELSEWLGLNPLLDRRPEGLSGGERQRVALGRALAFYPSVLCLDEPLSALDDETHTELCALLNRIQRETQVTTVHITHSRKEAEELGDCVFQLVDGQLLQLEGQALESDKQT